MKLDVFLTPAEISPADLSERTVAVIDVLRATSTMVEALAAGARAIYPVASIEEALRLANTLGRDDVLLCGERRCLRIDGFDLGNSPREFTRERVAGKTLVMSTTNGTVALSLAANARRVLVASLMNLGAVVDELVRGDADPVILCSGRERHLALEDAVTAGILVERMMEVRPGEWRLNDGAIAALTLTREFDLGEPFFRSTTAGRLIVDAGLDEDLAVCAEVDRHSLLPIYHDRHVTLDTGSATPPSK